MLGLLAGVSKPSPGDLEEAELPAGHEALASRKPSPAALLGTEGQERHPPVPGQAEHRHLCQPTPSEGRRQGGGSEKPRGVQRAAQEP